MEKREREDYEGEDGREDVRSGQEGEELMGEELRV